jgi:hypothetical protein
MLMLLAFEVKKRRVVLLTKLLMELKGRRSRRPGVTSTLLLSNLPQDTGKGLSEHTRAVVRTLVALLTPRDATRNGNHGFAV